MSKSLRGLVLCCSAAAAIVGLLCAGIQSWQRTPKVKVADIEQMIGASLPIGTPKKEVEAWLTSRSMPVKHDQDGPRSRFIASWIPDSGPPSEYPYGIRDIRLQFFFDESERLVRFTVKEEERF
jgi:hypothetical protein